jgi:hypothetical protein
VDAPGVEGVGAEQLAEGQGCAFEGAEADGAGAFLVGLVDSLVVRYHCASKEP